MIQDIRYAIRQLARHPGFTAIAILTLAIGIGANTSIFSAARATLYQPLPFEHEDRLVRVYLTPEAGGPLISLRPEVFLAVRDRASFFDRIVAQRFTSFVLSTDAGPERVVGIAVSEGWSETLGVRPILGRPFSPEEEVAGEDAGVALLSHSAWQNRYGGTESVIGQTVVLDGRARTVVGVMPPGFTYPYEAELWVPMRVRAGQAGVWSFNVPARLKPGWTVEQARADLASVAQAASSEVADLAPGTTLTAVPIREVLVGGEGRTLIALLAAVGFLLLIVCANLANLLLSRALGRGREFAVRAAVGAGRTRLLRQVLVESVILAILGGAAGLIVATIGFGLVGVIFGLAPALRLSHERPFSALYTAGRAIGGTGVRRLERALVVGELALALTLLSGIGLMLRDFQQLHQADLGYDPAGLLTFGITMSAEEYPDVEARTAFMTSATEELARVPGVAGVGATTMFPSSRANSVAEIVIEGRELRQGDVPLINSRMVTPGFLQAVGIPLLQGRGITTADRTDALPVVVISAGLARRYFPNEDPIGRRVRNGRSGEDAPWMTIVGVVGDVREFYEVDETWYTPYAQGAGSFLGVRAVFAVRNASRVSPAISSMREAMVAVDRNLPIYNAVTAEQLYAVSYSRQGQAAMLGSIFAGFALLLASIGIYGSISYGVSRRTREFGVRMALGSDRSMILRGVAAEGGKMVLAGMIIGGIGALILARFLSSALTEIGAFDVTTFAVSSTVLATAALGAVLIPAIRATRIDPVEALRHE
jgi:putative ABC transport system permease protein